MNYEKHYAKLMDRARNRVIDGYVETHHVVPRCMGGSDDAANLVRLTAEEHYVAHQLLHKMHPLNRSLTFAMMAMTGKTSVARSGNKVYAWMRRKAAVAASGLMQKLWKDPLYIEKHRAAMAKVRLDPAVGAKISAVQKGRVKSEQERANIAAASRNRKPRVFSAEARANMKAARLKTWADRRANGTDKDIGKKIAATRRKNGSYGRRSDTALLN